MSEDFIFMSMILKDDSILLIETVNEVRIELISNRILFASSSFKPVE